MQARANPLLIWDGSANGHVNGSIEMELEEIARIVAFKGEFKNWLYIPSIPYAIDETPDITLRDFAALSRQLIAIYGAVHIFDALPVLKTFTNGSIGDASDVAAGYPPRSVFTDGVHLSEMPQRAISAALTAPDGPMARVRAL